MAKCEILLSLDDGHISAVILCTLCFETFYEVEKNKYN